MKSRELRLLLVFVFVFSIIGASYALTKVSVQNTTNINTGLNIFITQPTQTTQICPADGVAAYKNTNIQPLFWNLTAGDPGIFYYFCIDNQGSVPDQLQVTISTTSTSIVLGSCPNTGGLLMNYVITVPPTDATLSPHTATITPVNINVCAGSNEPLGAGPTFTINVQ
jgi:hypothetical protein